jgi:hypothetical protein
LHTLCTFLPHTAVTATQAHISMPATTNITYSRKECITAVLDYYEFLTKLYLDESLVVKPPKGGWPSITEEAFQDLDKTDEVISLLRQLPYISREEDDAQGAPWCTFADWRLLGTLLEDGCETGEDLKVTTEDPEICEQVPSHVIGLTHGGRGNTTFLLDTKQGIVHWYECPSEIYSNATQEQALGDPDDYAPEEEIAWRTECAPWAVKDFFEVLKDLYRNLKFIPISPTQVIDVYATLAPGSEGMIDTLQSIYREHGWPDLSLYRKEECLEAVREIMEEQYPDFAEDE